MKCKEPMGVIPEYMCPAIDQEIIGVGAAEDKKSKIYGRVFVLLFRLSSQWELERTNTHPAWLSVVRGFVRKYFCNFFFAHKLTSPIYIIKNLHNWLYKCSI
jgi:hypothetical protein